MSTTDAGVARTRGANAAQNLVNRLSHLDDERVAVLAGILVAEALARGLAVPDLR